MSTLFPPPSSVEPVQIFAVVQVHICTEGMLNDFHFSHPDRLSKASGCSYYLEVTYVVFIDSCLLWHIFIFRLQVSEVVRRTDGVPQWKIHTPCTDTHIYSSSPFESIGFFYGLQLGNFLLCNLSYLIAFKWTCFAFKKAIIVKYLQSCCLNRIIAVDFSDFIWWKLLVFQRIQCFI